jgi:hypothetical protein
MGVSQVSTEWTMLDLPECHIWDACETDGKIYFLISSRHSIADTLLYDNISRVTSLYLEDDETYYANVEVETNYGRRFLRAFDIDVAHDQFVIFHFLSNLQSHDSVVVHTLNKQFDVRSNTSIGLNGSLFMYASTIVDSNVVGIGSIQGQQDSLLEVRGIGELHDSLSVKTFKTDPSISFVTSLAYDILRNRLLAFHISGILHLDDSLYAISNYSYSDVNTTTHGSLLVQGDNYYSFGLSFENVERTNSQLVFHKYDTGMQILFRDTLGIEGANEYPFIRKSLDFRNNHYFVGGFHTIPSIIEARLPLEFFLAKYDSNLNQIWLRIFGGDENFLISGIHATSDGGCIIYGSRIRDSDGIRYPYLLIVNSEGVVTQTESPQEELSDIMTFLNPSGNEFNLILNRDVSEFSIYSMNGQRVAQFLNLSQGSHILNVGSIAPGAYVVMAILRDKSIVTARWVKAQ